MYRFTDKEALDNFFDTYNGLSDYIWSHKDGVKTINEDFSVGWFWVDNICIVDVEEYT